LRTNLVRAAGDVAYTYGMGRVKNFPQNDEYVWCISRVTKPTLCDNNISDILTFSCNLACGGTLNVVGRGEDLNILTIFINVICSTERNLHLAGSVNSAMLFQFQQLVVSVTFVFAHQSHVMTFRTVLSTATTKGNIYHIH